jgi:putative FmdB family regulatory protein
MPTYQYLCEKCGSEFEIFQSMTDKALTTCPKEQCAQKKWGKGKVKRLIGAGAGLIFKGSGFYITDYRSKGYKEAAKKDTTSSVSSSDSKPAKPKTETKATPSKPAKVP